MSVDAERNDQPRGREPGNDFAFAVKFFGIVALVIGAIWWLNSLVG